MGSRRAAWRAGYQPKKMPTAAAMATDTTIAAGEIVVDHRRYWERTRAARRPTPTPVMPPITLNATDSSTNCARMSRARAPMARRIPISARPFGHRQQHDVHDPDPAHHERHRCNAGEQRRHRPGGAIERFAKLLERHLVETGHVADDGARDIGSHAAFGKRLARLCGDGEIVRLLVADAVPRAKQSGDRAHHPRHVSGRGGRDCDVVQLREVQQTMDGAERNVDRVELIIARSRRHHPALRRHDADDAKRLPPDRDLPSHRIRAAEQTLGGDRAEDDHLLGARLLAVGEEAAAAERPGAPNQRQLEIGAVKPREPPRPVGGDVHVLMQALCDILHARNAADRVGVVGGKRRRRAEARFAVAEALTRRRVIVLLHRIVFGVRRKNRLDERQRATPERIRRLERRRRLDGAAAEVVRRFHLVVARGDHDQVHARRADLVADRGFGAGSNRDHRQHRGDANRHPDDRQRRLQPVAP